MTAKTTSRTVTAREQQISYQLTRKNVKNINLRVKPDGQVTVSAPARVTAEQIDQFVRAKADFILRARQRFQALRPEAAALHYQNGESIPFLGRTLGLRLQEDPAEGVEADRTHLTLTVRDCADEERKRRIVQQFLRKQCQTVFQATLEALYPRVKPAGVAKPALKIRSMKTRWGSCSPARQAITLNTRLIETPLACIEYVVMHELCHFLQPNHSQAFYALLNSYMPDWRERKARLNAPPEHA